MQSGAVIDEYGIPLKPNAPYIAQQIIYYYRHVPDEPTIAVQEAIIFEDEWLVIADKPHFLPVAPVGRYVQETLLVRLKKKLGLSNLAPMHRIDLETAGLVCFTKQPHTRAAYAALFAQHQVQKRYLARAKMHDHAHITFPVNIANRIVPAANFMQSSLASGGAINARTEVHLNAVEDGIGEFNLHPLTGKKHQLRLHMASIGLPILYDNIYPVFQPEAPRNPAAPLQLLAQHISFIDPVTHENRAFESKLQLLPDTAQARK